MKNSSFSLRAFSSQLQMNHSALLEFLNGKRKIGPRGANRIAQSMMLPPEVREKVFTRPTASMTYSTLQADQFRSISEWYHFAILSLAETKGFKSDSDWIAKRLGIRRQEAQMAIDRLLRLKMIERQGTKLVPTGQAFSSPDGVADLAVRSTHHKYLEMAQESLHRDSVDQRDFTSITMAIDPKKIPEARKRIRKFRDELCTYLESKDKIEVYEFCLQLFPLTKEI